jgi:hypothetical protein
VRHKKLRRVREPGLQRRRKDQPMRHKKLPRVPDGLRRRDVHERFLDHGGHVPREQFGPSQKTTKKVAKAAGVIAGFETLNSGGPTKRGVVSHGDSGRLGATSLKPISVDADAHSDRTRAGSNPFLGDLPGPHQQARTITTWESGREWCHEILERLELADPGVRAHRHWTIPGRHGASDAVPGRRGRWLPRPRDGSDRRRALVGPPAVLGAM